MHFGTTLSVTLLSLLLVSTSSAQNDSRSRSLGERAEDLCKSSGNWSDCTYTEDTGAGCGHQGAWHELLPQGYTLCASKIDRESASPDRDTFTVMEGRYGIVINYNVPSHCGFPIGGERTWLKIIVTLRGNKTGAC